jgi:hypothetical protein
VTTALSLPEASTLLLCTRQDRVRFPGLYPSIVKAATLRELELRERIRVSPLKRGLFEQKTPFTLELLDTAPTGDKALDASLDAIRPEAMRADTDLRRCERAMMELRLGLNLVQEYLDRLVRGGWLRVTGRTLFVKRPKYGVANVSGVEAMAAELFAALVGDTQLNARDEALAALFAAHAGSSVTTAAMSRIAPRDATDAGARELLLGRAAARAMEARHADMIARALFERLAAGSSPGL